jgi:hypothetical protein
VFTLIPILAMLPRQLVIVLKESSRLYIFVDDNWMIFGKDERKTLNNVSRNAK